METNRTYKLSDIIRELKLTRKSVPSTKVIIGWLKGTEFDMDNNVSSNSVYDYKQSRACKHFIESVIKVKLNEQRIRNKSSKVFLYISVGGTKELQNQFKLEITDHMISKILSPKGCDKYCTENQIGKPTNWIKMPVVVLNSIDDFEEIRKSLNVDPFITKISNNTYVYKNTSFMEYIKTFRNNIQTNLNNAWFKSNYGV